MKILAIDPGTERSAWLVYESEQILAAGIEPNDDMVAYLRLLREPVCGHVEMRADILVIEKIESFGMPVGAEIFETVFWSGRFAEAWGGLVERISRRAVKLHLCNSVRAKDSNIRQALIGRLGPPGTKKSPGATYGIKKDLWSCLAIACTFADTHEAESKRSQKQLTS